MLLLFHGYKVMGGKFKQLLGSPFLAANSMVLAHASRTANDKVSNVEILSICPLEPAPLQKRSSPKERALRILSASASA